jgi:hypothetical protein
MRGDDQKHTGERERYAGDDCPCSVQPEPRDLCGSQPDPSKEHEQEPDFGKARAGVMRESEDDGHARHCSADCGAILRVLSLIELNE